MENILIKINNPNKYVGIGNQACGLLVREGVIDDLVSYYYLNVETNTIELITERISKGCVVKDYKDRIDFYINHLRNRRDNYPENDELDQLGRNKRELLKLYNSW